MKITTILLGAMLLLTGCGQETDSLSYREGVEPSEIVESSEDRLNFGHILPDNDTGTNPTHGIEGRLMFGDIEEILTFEVINEFNDKGYIAVLDITVEIEHILNDKQTIKQNFLNIINMVVYEGADQFDVINYNAIALMNDGNYASVVSFDVPQEAIQLIADHKVIADNLPPLVDNLYIHHSLEHDLY